MPKLKTRKAVTKRIKVTKNKKLKIRHGGQGHFNAREDGNTKKKKRRDNTLSEANRNQIEKALPYDL